MDEKIMNRHFSELYNELFPPEHRAKMREIYEGIAKEVEEYMGQNKDKAVNDADMVPYDSKTAFLSELKGLLEKYGAELGDSGVYEIEGMEVTFDNGDRIRYKHCTINALNIMDYENE